MYDVSTYEPGAGYDVAPDTGAPAPVAAAPAAPIAPAVAAAPAAPATEQPAAEPVEEKQPAGEEQPKTEVEAAASYELQVPSFVDTREITDERQQHLTEFSALAPTVGIDAPTAQALLDVVIDSAVALGDYVQDPDATADDARAAMVQFFGEKDAKALIQNAQRYTRSRGAAFSDWLDQSGLGNDPAALLALAFADANYFNQTPEQAQAKIDKFMREPDYVKGGKMLQVKLHVLSRIANRGGAMSQEDQLREAAKAAAAKPATPAPKSDGRFDHLKAAAAASSTDAKSEMKALMKLDSPLFVATHPDHAKAVARFHSLSKV